jgi:hypothetical protein
MMSFRPTRKFSRFAVVTVFGAAIVIGCAGSYARAADDDDDEMIDTKVFRYLLQGLGLRRDGGTGIDYRERSPLVLPPGNELNQLPSPENAGRAKQVSNWPVDPDIKRTRQRKEAERKRKAPEPGVDDRPLMPDKMTELPPPSSTGSKAGEAPGRSAEGAERPSTPGELGSKGFMDMFKTGLWAPKEEYVPFTGEPARTSLTEPPRGYRTPSPAQPYGVGKDKWIAPTIDKNEPAK